MLQALEKLGLNAVAILATHHHVDHVGGNVGVLKRFPTARVFGYRTDKGRIPGQTDLLDDKQEFDVAGIGVKALHIPGHTLGAVAYVAEGAAFTGDVVRLLQSLPEEGDIAVRLSTRTGAAQDGSFLLGGLKMVREKVAAACKWPHTIAKPRN